MLRGGWQVKGGLSLEDVFREQGGGEMEMSVLCISCLENRNLGWQYGEQVV